MIILGLQFGHDSSLCVLRDGVILASLIKERKSRIRHAIGIDWSDVEDVLSAAGVEPEQVDYCSITSTQDIEYLFFDPKMLSFKIGRHHAHALPSPYYDQIAARPNMAAQLRGRFRLAEIFNGGQQHHYRQLFAQYNDLDLARVAAVPSVEDFAYAPLWERASSLQEIRHTDYSGLINDTFARSFHLPVVATLAGHVVPGALFSHHYAHAAYAYFSSPFDSAAVLSHDGGSTRRGYRAGMFYWGNGAMLYPLTPHYLPLGWMYYTVSVALGLGTVGGEGKLMGLSAYGQPALFAADFLGNWFDGPRVGEAKHPERWIDHMLAAADSAGYDRRPFGDPRRVTEPINANIAMSTQKLFEETMLIAVDALRGGLQASGIEEPRLCLAGGTALNCPTNSRIAAETAYHALYVPPACDDSGLSMGSAYALYHCLLGNRRSQVPANPQPQQAYLGCGYSEQDIRAAVQQFANRVTAEECLSTIEEAAALLHDNAVIAWFQGRSEVGPRALGHRSILANPVQHEQWLRVNRIKGREAWRPLAPMVIEEQAADWFDGAPIPSPYMLFTATVRSDRIPAVTHVDRSARFQTVSPANGPLYDLLTAFQRRSGVPVLLNTSFNGPGEPIVETPADALRFFVNSELDALFIGPLKLTRRPAS